jgi:uncharacterized protein (TIGR02118 family)
MYGGSRIGLAYTSVQKMRGMVVRFTVLYSPAADSAAFHKYYVETHVPIAKKLPGLQEYTVSDGAITGPDGTPAPYELVANLTFASRDAVRAALGSPEFAATGADLGNFAQAGVAILMYEEKPV